MTDEKTEVKDDKKQCQVCNEYIDPVNFNEYYGACDSCVNKSGRL